MRTHVVSKTPIMHSTASSTSRARPAGEGGLRTARKLGVVTLVTSAVPMRGEGVSPTTKPQAVWTLNQTTASSGDPRKHLKASPVRHSSLWMSLWAPSGRGRGTGRPRGAS